jgi:hypothetical protein
MSFDDCGMWLCTAGLSQQEERAAAASVEQQPCNDAAHCSTPLKRVCSCDSCVLATLPHRLPACSSAGCAGADCAGDITGVSC